MRSSTCPVLVRHVAAVLCALALSAPGARADEPTKAPKVPKLAVVDIRATGNSDPKAATALSSLIATEAGRFPVKVIAGSDLVTLIGFDKQKHLLGCSDASCLAEVGGALGVDYLLSSEIGEFGGRWLLTLVLLDVVRSSSLRRVTRQAKSQAELLDAVAPAMAEALQAFARSSATAAPDAKLVAAEPAKPEPGTPQASTVTATAGNQAGSRKTAGFVLVGGGGALLIGGAVAGLLAKNEHDDAKAGLATATQKSLDDAKSRIDTRMWIADALYAGGAIAAAVGIVLVVNTPAVPKASIALAPSAFGGALVLSGGF